MSAWDWLIAVAYIASTTIPFFKIFPRAGVPGWMGLFGLLPGAPIVYVWVLAFMKWPQDE
jgi:hypothetical protein